MVYANLVTWKFKSGMREKALETIDKHGDEGMKTEGFKGMLAFDSVDDPNTAYILSLWDSEESLDEAREGLIKSIQGEIRDMAAEPPAMKILKAREMAAQMVSIPA